MLAEWGLKSAETTPQITLDDALDENSENAVKNKVISTGNLYYKIIG